VVEVRYIDSEGSPRSVRPRVVVNATGPWAEQTARLAGCRSVRLILRKGVHLIVPGTPLRHALILPDASGRHIGLYPREGESWAGPTDDPYSGSPDEARGTVSEGEALRAALLRRLPALESQGSPRTVAGLRPIVRSMMPGLLSRDYKVFDHAGEGAANFLTVTGGKLTTYRPMAEETLHSVMLKLERPPAPEEIPEDMGTLTRALATHNRLLSFGLSLILMAFFWLRHRARGAPETGGLDEFKRKYGRTA
jgi:glycerol-3-phosphate dehydrogenase